MKCTGINCPMQVGYPVDQCESQDCPYRTEPLTIADRIRAMTDEELAMHLLAEADLCKFCNTDGFCVGYPYPTGNDNRCVEAVIKWLQQPCEESPTGQKG